MPSVFVELAGNPLESLYLLIPIALIFVALFLALLIWAVNRGQYDDLDKDAWRALNDDLDQPVSRGQPAPHQHSERDDHDS